MLILDVSRWEVIADWGKVSPRPELVICKASEGVTWTDPTFAANRAGLRSNGIPHGAYHYFIPDLAPERQAAQFLKVISSDPGSIPPVLDVEARYGSTGPALAKQIKVWLDIVEAATGRKPMIYTAAYVWRDRVCDWLGRPPSWTSDYPLWVANYYAAKPAIPRGWFEWVLWQYDEHGRVDGILGEVDLNRFNGTMEELHKFAGITAPPPPPAPSGFSVRVLVANLSFRAGPSTSDMKISTLSQNEVCAVVGLHVPTAYEVWLRLQRADGSQGWAALVYNSSRFMEAV